MISIIPVPQPMPMTPPLLIYLHGKQRKCGSEDVPENTVCGERRGSVVRFVGIEEVEGSGAEDGEVADRYEGAGYYGGHPLWGFLFLFRLSRWLEGIVGGTR